jgi:hypothetical protein
MRKRSPRILGATGPKPPTTPAGRLWVSGGGDGKVRIFLGSAAVREKRKLAREIDRTIARAFRGDLEDSDTGAVERLAALADRLARGGT